MINDFSIITKQYEPPEIWFGSYPLFWRTNQVEVNILLTPSIVWKLLNFSSALTQMIQNISHMIKFQGHMI